MKGGGLETQAAVRELILAAWFLGGWFVFFSPSPVSFTVNSCPSRSIHNYAIRSLGKTIKNFLLSVSPQSN